jgi:predicted permease
MRTLLLDLRFALRQLRKAPGFTLLAVVTLALGIGANTAMFTVMDNVLLRPLPYAGANRLQTITPSANNTASTSGTSWLDYRDLHNGMKNVARIAGYSEDFSVVKSRDTSLAVAASRLTPNLLPMLGVKPLMGTAFTPEDALVGGPQVVLLSAGIWKKEFHSDPDIVGKTVQISGEPHTVVGVMPASFHFPEDLGPAAQDAVWLPLQPNAQMLKDRGYDFLLILAKLKPGVTAAHARAQLNHASQVISNLHKNSQGQAFTLFPYSQQVVGKIGPVLDGLAAALLLVLLIACANVANLLIARAIGRQQEFAARVALGAGRGRLLRQVTTESALLSLLGCVAGFGMAWLAIAAIHKLPAGTIPRMNTIHIRWSVVLVMAAIATLTTALSSLLPAIMVSGTNPQATLRAASRGVGTRTVRGKLTGWLVSAEIALATLLLVGTGLLARTMWNLEHAWLGFQTTRVTTFQLTPPNAAGFSNMQVLSPGAQLPASVNTTAYIPALSRLRQAPGVKGAAITTILPLSGVHIRTSYQVIGHKVSEQNAPNAMITAISGDYARVMDTPILRGRMIDSDDTANSTPVVVINQALANQSFHGKNPIGQQLDLGGKDTGILIPPTIVGVIANQRNMSLQAPAEPMMMLPTAQVPTSSLFYEALLNTVVNVVVKTRGNVPIAREARDVFRQVAPGYALDTFQTMSKVVDQTTFSQKLGLELVASFATLALLMVLAGLYGVLAQFVGFRRREIGIRIALGASRGDVLRMIFRQSLLMAAYGLTCGLLISLFAGRLVRSFLFGVRPFDLPTYAGVLGLLLLVSVVAAVWPARQAASVDPMTTLRME